MNKMLHRGFGLAICLALALSLVLPAMMLAATYPCNFFGTASVDGEPVADGTAITAWAENLATHEMDEVGSTTTTSVPVAGFYTMVVNLDTATHSTTIHFKIGTLNATETATWAMYGNVETDLTASTTPLPIVTAVDPDQGYQGDDLDVTITGTNFNGATSVSFGAGITVNDFDVDSNTQITADITIAAGATPGTRDVSVTTPEGTGTLEDGFTVLEEVPGPTVTAVNPDQGYRGETLDVTITGTNFNGATSVSFGAGITVNDFDVDSNTQITADITIAAGATLGTRDVSVTTPEGTGTLEDGFTVLEEVPEPTVTAVDPDQGYQGETLDVVITGTNFNWATSVSFGAGITVNDFDVDSNTQITASISIAAAATLGTRDVSVTTTGGTDTLEDSFTVVEPGEWIDVPLYVGMTIVPAYPGFDNDLPANLPAEAVMVWHQVTADEATPEIPAGTWLHWTRGAPPQFNSLHTLVAGKAYLVSATAACVWSVPAT
jgi:hypothetical protein